MEPKILLSEEQINKRVEKMGAKISSDADGRKLNIIAVLDDGFMLMADLVRHMTCPVQCQFLRMATVDLMQDGHERRQILYDSVTDVEGNDFLLVDAVLHTGVTMDHLVQQLLTKGARSVKTAVLIDKMEERRVDLKPDYWGFQIKEGFLVGYGLGHNGLYQNLPYVAELKAAGKAAPVTAPQGAVKA